MTQRSSGSGFEIPNSTVALLLVLTIVFTVWSFAVVTTSISSPGAAQVTGADNGPSAGSLGFWIGERPVANNPIQRGSAQLTIVEVPEGEAAQ